MSQSTPKESKIKPRSKKRQRSYIYSMLAHLTGIEREADNKRPIRMCYIKKEIECRRVLMGPIVFDALESQCMHDTEKFFCKTCMKRHSW